MLDLRVNKYKVIHYISLLRAKNVRLVLYSSTLLLYRLLNWTEDSRFYEYTIIAFALFLCFNSFLHFPCRPHTDWSTHAGIHCTVGVNAIMACSQCMMEPCTGIVASLLYETFGLFFTLEDVVFARAGFKAAEKLSGFNVFVND